MFVLEAHACQRSLISIEVQAANHLHVLQQASVDSLVFVYEFKHRICIASVLRIDSIAEAVSPSGIWQGHRQEAFILFR
ncbi:hypothetical protein [Lysobacter gummosus]|uniref:hypothetical protein n=1 Tax=Lysobacter gummosus TaxID=262324 RepID=UPI00362E107C